MKIIIKIRPDRRSSLSYVYEQLDSLNEDVKFAIEVDNNSYEKMLKNDNYYYISIPYITKEFTENICVPYDMVDVEEYKTDVILPQGEILEVDPRFESEELYYLDKEGNLKALYFNPYGFSGCGQFIEDVYSHEDLVDIIRHSTEENFFDELYGYEPRRGYFIDCCLEEFKECAYKMQQNFGESFKRCESVRIMLGSTIETYLRIVAMTCAYCCIEKRTIPEKAVFWNKIYDSLTSKDDASRELYSAILMDTMSVIDNDTVYEITDYLRNQYYTQKRIK